MGPYSQHTTQGIGSVFDLLYKHPILMVIFVVGAIVASIYFWRKNKAG
jgi:type II secretory pathway component PulF